MGYSFGGYHAPRVAAFEKRYAAAVAFGAMYWNIYDYGRGQQGQARGRSAHELHLDLPIPLGGGRARQRDRARMGEEVHARRRRTADRMRVPGAARRERSHRAARGSKEALRAGRLEAQAHQDFHRRGRRRRALPGRSPPARRRLHRRLAAREHVSRIFLTRVTRIFQDSAFSKFALGRSRQKAATHTWGRQRWALVGACDFPVTALLLPVLFLPPSRFPVDSLGVAFTAPVFLLLFTGKNRHGLHLDCTLRLRHGHEFAQAPLRWRSRFAFVWE